MSDAVLITIEVVGAAVAITGGFLVGRASGYRAGVNAQRAATADVVVCDDDVDRLPSEAAPVPFRRQRNQWE